MPSFHFKGKAFLQNYHHSVKFHKLNPLKEKGVCKQPSLSDNLLVQGDNLKALKALLPTHAGKVKCIYIDPPYNTGNEHWKYNDNVASPMIQEWLGKEVGIDDLARHDKWCCMMYPRLVFLRELLAEDGVICISIGDEEYHRLRLMLDEIFGYENYRNTITVKRYDKNISRQFMDNGLASLSIGFEYLLVYSKSDQSALNPVYREASEKRQNEGYWKGFWNSADRPTMRYELLGVKPDEGQWKWKEESAIEAVENYEEFKKKFSKKMSLEEYWEETGRKKKFIRRRKELKTGKNLGVEHWIPPSDGILLSSNWTDLLASKTIDQLGLKFDSPKNPDFIKRVIEMASDEDDIILDSFAGSGTTAHAVLALNQEDGGNRKFILVECEDYADEITGERIRRIIKGVPDAKDKALRKGLGGTFSYYELGEELEMDKILEGSDLPSYEELARYAFFTSTGENWDESTMEEDTYYIGSSSTFEVFLLYAPDKQKLKELALNLDFAMKVHNRFPNKQKLIFAPACFMEEYHLKEYGIRFAQLPFEIYRMAE